MSRPKERRTQHAVMATASEWARIRELAAAADMDLSRYLVHRATVPDPLPDAVLRRAVRECCSAWPFDPPESKRINMLPCRSASNLRA